DCRAAGAVNEDEVADDSPLKGGGREEKGEEDSPSDFMPKRSSPMSCSRPDTRAEQPRGSRKTLTAPVGRDFADCRESE
ncbi:Orotidine 5'-phosphate decarboxylase, partial [Dissostichus eleginoides]